MTTKKNKPYTHNEFLSLITAIVKERNLDYFDQLDYIIASDRENTLTSEEISLRSDTHWGSCEGVYTSFFIRTRKGDTNIFTAKTLGESNDDYIKMHILAANICLIADEYVRDHGEEFNWEGYDVSSVKDGQVRREMWCHEKDNALGYAEALKNNGYGYQIRDNRTRKIIASAQIQQS